MNYWGEYPFLRILFSFIAGIIFYLATGVCIPLWLPAVAFFIILLIHYLHSSKSITQYRQMIVVSISIQILFFLFGDIQTFNSTGRNDSKHFIHYLNDATWMVVRITSPLVEKEKSYKSDAEVIAWGNKSVEETTLGKSILYFRKDSLSKIPGYGSILIVKNNFKEVSPPKNPDEFNYQNYLQHKNIYATCFLNTEEWRLLPQQRKNFAYQFTFWLLQSSLDAIRKYIPDHTQSAVCEGLVIGYRDDMSQNVQQSYASAGVVHVLAVSGMQIGILFAFLHQLLFFMNRKKHGKLLQSVIIIGIIWLFAMLTGLSGSVVRAAMMFSFVTVGKNLKRPVNVYNILACSAFFILLVNPMLILDAGLQLSYFAVIGIIALHPYMNSWVYSENKLVNFCWTTISMSLAAQVATLPLTVYLFNQFPTYFLLANLAVIPAAAIILYLGMGLILLQSIPVIAVWIGKVSGFIIGLLDEFITRIQMLPFSVIHLSSIYIQDAILLALILVFIILYFIKNQKRLLWGGLICIAGLMISQQFESFVQSQCATVTVYSIKGQSDLEFRAGNEVVLFEKNGSVSSDLVVIQRHWQLSGVAHADFHSYSDSLNDNLHDHLVRGGSFFQLNSYRLFVASEPLVINKTARKINVDAILISCNPNLDLKTLLSYFKAGIVVFDSSNAAEKIRKWKVEAAEAGIKTFDVNKEGAFIQEI